MSLPAVLLTESGTAERRARVVNLGLGGACLELRETPPNDETVALLLTTPTLWDPLTIRARVAWMALAEDGETHRIGVHFAYGDGAPLDALVEIIATSGYE